MGADFTLEFHYACDGPLCRTVESQVMYTAGDVDDVTHPDRIRFAEARAERAMNAERNDPMIFGTNRRSPSPGDYTLDLERPPMNWLTIGTTTDVDGNGIYTNGVVSTPVYAEIGASATMHNVVRMFCSMNCLIEYLMPMYKNRLRSVAVRTADGRILGYMDPGGDSLHYVGDASRMQPQTVNFADIPEQRSDNDEDNDDDKFI